MQTLIRGNIFTGVLKPVIGLKYLNDEVNVGYIAVFIEQLELIKAGTIETIKVEDLKKMKSLQFTDKAVTDQLLEVKMAAFKAEQIEAQKNYQEESKEGKIASVKNTLDMKKEWDYSTNFVH